MIIDWYPGHMKKARAQIIEVLPSIDLFIEVLDARLPDSSSNPLLERLRKDKPCIKVLNKSDLADPTITKAWVTHFDKQQSVRALPLEATDRRNVGLLPKLCRKLVPNRGNKGQKPLRVMIIGIPNVGKSTLINTLAGKKIARVGDKPAITTCPQQIDLRNGILLSDTPGLLWPVLENQAGACRLAASGAIGDNAFDTTAVAMETAAYLAERYQPLLQKRYKLQELPAGSVELLEEIGRRRGCLVSGGDVDLHRAAELLLRELRSGKIGRISLERPSDIVVEAAPDKEEDL
ncbi:ribosome biogenesis GTPase A [Malonomonas rubra DSM 5091]|uniref:Ribosome biogenesis GTPase A n=1 Tax=Malonomonas rubra DSM 5091 TaxID=1122189 RepID=A0A1M6IUP8_MALRU|nr:ribosome biogenesis GTPase YlqF [Malonomonas rubra]SHJ38176.1 ribosome biogenesis GTPase A [Malonomonas rubra DSM 5091]